MFGSEGAYLADSNQRHILLIFRRIKISIPIMVIIYLRFPAFLLLIWKDWKCRKTACFKVTFKTISFYISTDYSILFYPITLKGRRGTTDELATIPFHLALFLAALVKLAKSIPVQLLILSSHPFFCLSLFLFPFAVSCRIVFDKPEDLEKWRNHLSFRFLTRVRSSSYSPMAAWIFL